MKKLILLLLLTTLSFPLLSRDNNEKKPEKNVMKPALIVIDIQNEFLKYMSSDKEMALEMINWAIWVARQNDIPVIRVYHTNPESGPEPGSEAYAYPKTIQIKDDDPKVIKNYPDGFKKTELDKILKEKGCNTLFLCGLSATGCVLATYHGAMDLDYNVFMLRDAIISHDHQLTDAVEKICESVSLETFNFMMKNLIR